MHKGVSEQGNLFVRGTVVWRKACQSPADEIREDFPEEVMAKLLYREEKELLCALCPPETGAQGPPDGQPCIAPGAEFETTSAPGSGQVICP